MSDNRSAELEKLFEEWRERHESENCSSENISKSNFIPDGIIDEASYMQSPKKILFVAKEAACLKKGNTIEKKFRNSSKRRFLVPQGGARGREERNRFFFGARTSCQCNTERKL